MINYVLLGIIAFILLACAFLFFFPIVQICGYSMFPTMIDGEFYLGRRVLRKDKCKCGEIYVYKPPYDSKEERYVIKRLSGYEYGSGGKVKYYFLGDNQDDSYDSRYYGCVDSHNVVAHISEKRGVK